MAKGDDKYFHLDVECYHCGCHRFGITVEQHKDIDDRSSNYPAMMTFHCVDCGETVITTTYVHPHSYWGERLRGRDSRTTNGRNLGSHNPD